MSVLKRKKKPTNKRTTDMLINEQTVNYNFRWANAKTSEGRSACEQQRMLQRKSKGLLKNNVAPSITQPAVSGGYVTSGTGVERFSDALLYTAGTAVDQTV